MNFKLRLVFAAAAVVGLACPGSAQTFYGPGGLFVHPTAFTPKQGSMKLGVSYLSQESKTGDGQYVPITLAYSVTDRFVAGALAIHHGGDAHEHVHGGAFAQYQIVPDGASHPAFAISGAYRNKDWMQTSLAGVVSHRFARPNDKPLLTGHLGLKYGRNPKGSEDVAPFVGVEVPIATDFRFVGEASTRMSFDQSAAHGIGIVWKRPGAPSVGIGMVNTGRGKQEGFYWGVGYPLGGGS